MKKTNISIEVFCAPNCNRCGKTVTLIQQTVEQLNTATIHWRKVNVVEEIDYAVQLGVRATPSIAINGELIFTSTPDKETLKQKILAFL